MSGLFIVKHRNSSGCVARHSTFHNPVPELEEFDLSLTAQQLAMLTERRLPSGNTFASPDSQQANTYRYNFDSMGLTCEFLADLVETFYRSIGVDLSKLPSGVSSPTR